MAGVGEQAEVRKNRIEALGLGRQQTLAASFQRSGIGLHTGQQVNLQVLPAAANTGRYFVRVDLPHAPVVPARSEAIHATRLSTELKAGAASVRTVEHLLAALTGLGIDNARIELDGPEVPLLDGSAQSWVEAIHQAGTAPQLAQRPNWAIAQPIWIQASEIGHANSDAFVAAIPAAQLRFTYGIEFELAAIGQQWQSWLPAQACFATEIAPARTFGLANQVEALQQQGLIRGGSLENALVCDASGWLNPPLRFPNEPVRHKLLDLVGDLSLLGQIPTAHFLAYKASHELHAELVRRLVQSQTQAQAQEQSQEQSQPLPVCSS
jgi:UDP-3-O-[3-hydroxymyristoyl] N-acetylglucosamine deacetylase